MANPFYSEIDALFKRILELQSTLFQISHVLEKDLKRQKNAEPEAKNRFPVKSFSNLVISDLSGKTDNGWEINFATHYDKTIKWDEYGQEIENLIARESGYTIAQSCEAFVRFLKYVVAIQLMQNKEKAIELDKDFSDCETKEDFKEQLRNVDKLHSPKFLFDLLSDTCGKYR